MKTIKSVCKIGTGPSGSRTRREMDEKYRPKLTELMRKAGLEAKA